MAESLGSLLRQKRESLGLTLEEVERHTHIRIKHLQAIEADDLSAIPSVPQARGFIRNYTAFLGITPEELAARTGEAKPKPPAPPTAKISPPVAAAPPSAPTSAPRTAPNPATEPVSPFREDIATGVPTLPRPETYARPRALADRSAVREWFRFDRIFGGIIALTIIGLLGWGGYSMAMNFSASPKPAATESFLPAGSETPTGSPAADQTAAPGTLESATGETPPSGTVELTPGATPSESVLLPGTLAVATLAPTSFPTPLGGVYTDVRIHITVLQHAYLMVTVDGNVKFSDRVQPGDTYDYIGQRTVTLATGNGAAISVLFNGVDEGALGRFGEVVALTYTPQGVLTPTPAATLTPTITPTVTPTLTRHQKNLMPSSRRYFLLTLGCAKNTVNSDSMAELLGRSGLLPAARPALADVIVVNTCGFIGPAREELLSALRELAGKKRSGQWLIAAGCLSQRMGAELARLVPGLDGVMGTRRWMDVLAVLEEVRSRADAAPVLHLPPGSGRRNGRTRRPARRGARRERVSENRGRLQPHLRLLRHSRHQGTGRQPPHGTNSRGGAGAPGPGRARAGSPGAGYNHLRTRPWTARRVGRTA